MGSKKDVFVSLKDLRDNWSKAVGIFFDAVNSKSAVRLLVSGVRIL